MTKEDRKIMPNGHFDTNEGIHKYAIAGGSGDSIRRQTNDFYMKVLHNNTRVISESRRVLPSGAIHIVFTYEI